MALITLTAAVLSLFVRESSSIGNINKKQDEKMKIGTKEAEKSHQNSGFEMDKPVWFSKYYIK